MAHFMIRLVSYQIYELVRKNKNRWYIFRKINEAISVNAGRIMGNYERDD
ncbi:MAG: hypothetical protein K2X48_03890 [Chitinophagaceae bacterium]|nr:hypothetical protein [Chitinophagaceae bacterium]